MATPVDLNESTQPETQATCDVCVIGAGAAGLYLVRRLACARLRVIVLEAGGATCESGAAIGIQPVFTDSHYSGAMDGRAFGWGGTTSRWGGLLVPYSYLDLRDDATPASTTWKHIVQAVEERSSAVLSTLGLDGSAEFFSLPEAVLGRYADLLHDCGLETIAAEALPFRRRNLTYLASARTGGDSTVYLNAVASKWFVTPCASGKGAVSAVEATSPNGKRLRVSATSFVIAAGAIESARILLEIDRVTGEQMFSRSSGIGSNLSDHLSCAIADVHFEDREKTSTLFGPMFSKGRMRSFRFVEASMEPSAPRCFAHFIFDMDNAGFRLAKDILCGLQSRALPKFRISDVIEGIGGLFRLAYNRYIKSTLFIPRHTPAHLQLDIEQVPDPTNRVRLGEESDRCGRPMAVVNWRVSELDLENIRTVSRRLLMKWPGQSGGFPRLIPIEIVGAQPKPYDAYHPVGTCKMGTDGGAVVDYELRVRETRNLYVLSTGLFPSAGTANPTFSMLCLGDMLADRLANYHAGAEFVESVQQAKAFRTQMRTGNEQS